MHLIPTAFMRATAAASSPEKLATSLQHARRSLGKANPNGHPELEAIMDRLLARWAGVLRRELATRPAAALEG